MIDDSLDSPWWSRPQYINDTKPAVDTVLTSLMNRVDTLEIGIAMMATAAITLALAPSMSDEDKEAALQYVLLAANNTILNLPKELKQEIKTQVERGVRAQSNHTSKGTR